MGNSTYNNILTNDKELFVNITIYRELTTSYSINYKLQVKYRDDSINPIYIEKYKDDNYIIQDSKIEGTYLFVLYYKEEKINDEIQNTGYKIVINILKSDSIVEIFSKEIEHGNGNNITLDKGTSS